MQQLDTVTADGPREVVAGKPVGAARSAMRLMAYASERAEPWSATEAARALGLNASTCFNIVQTLVADGFLSAAGDVKRYVLGPQTRALARRVEARARDLGALQPAMQALADRWKVTATLWHRSSATRMELIAVATCQSAVNIQMPIGQRLPLLVGGMGRVMALQGGLDEAERQAAFDEVHWQRPFTMANLLAQARQAQRLGWGLDEGYMHRSVTAIGVPVRRPGDAGPVTYVCSATMFRHQYARVALLQMAEDLKPIAARAAELVARD